jgi:hypothetical protein
MTIGRVDGNSLVLNTNMVSRQHARIDFDGSNYTVTDLNSTNHTFIGNTQLLPGVPEPWTPNQPLRVGDVWLRLVRSSASAAGTVVGPGVNVPTGVASGTRVAPAAGAPMFRSSVGGGQVGISMEESILTVEPGSSVTTGALLLNQGSVVDHFQVVIEGIPAQWLDLPSVVQLMPGQQQQVTFTIRPPKTFQSRAGRYNFIVGVISQNNPNQRVDVRGTLTVLPFSQFTSQLHPEKIAAGKTVKVTVNNQGNIREAFDISGEDRADALTFEPPHVRVGAAEGQSASAELRLSAGKRPLLGRTQSYPFTIHVSHTKAQPQIHAGELVSKPIIPSWVPPIVITLALLICVTLAMLLTRPPVIELAEVIPPNPVAGEPVTIHWRVKRTQNIELRPRGIELSVSGEGEYTFTEGFDESVSITLVASNLFRNTQETLNIDVDALIVEPVVEDWSVFPTEVMQGQEVTIKWSVVNAESIKVQPFGTVDSSGERKESPQQTRTYTLIATNQGKSVELSQEVIVNIPEPDAPKLTTFSVEPTTLVTSQDATVRLTWQTEQADTVTIEPGLGVVGLSGSRDVPAPTQDTIYTLVAKGPGGETQGQVQVFVQEPKCLVGSNVNLRSGPGTSYEPPITILSMGTELEPLSYSATGFPDGQWVEVKVVPSGETGWINVAYVANCNVTVTELPPGTIPATPTPTQTATPTLTPTPTNTGFVFVPLPKPLIPLYKPIASYPLDGDAKDSTGNYGQMTFKNVIYKGGGIYLNGVAYDVATTPQITGLDYNKFTIQAEFYVTQKKRMPVFVGGTSYRWIGAYLNSDGKMQLLYNNSKYANCSLDYQLNKWHKVSVTYDGNVGKLYLDDKLACQASFNLEHGNDRNVTTGDYSTGRVYNGYLKNLQIYNLVITPK